MPTYEVELHDGRRVEVDADTPPTESELVAFNPRLFGASQTPKSQTPLGQKTLAKFSASAEAKSDPTGPAWLNSLLGALGSDNTQAVVGGLANPIGAATRLTAQPLNALASSLGVKGPVASEYKGIPMQGVLEPAAQMVEQAVPQLRGQLTAPWSPVPGVAGAAEGLGSAVLDPRLMAQLPLFATGAPEAMPLATSLGRYLMGGQVLSQAPEQFRQTTEQAQQPETSVAQNAQNLLESYLGLRIPMEMTKSGASVPRDYSKEYKTAKPFMGGYEPPRAEVARIDPEVAQGVKDLGPREAFVAATREDLKDVDPNAALNLKTEAALSKGKADQLWQQAASVSGKQRFSLAEQAGQQAEKTDALSERQQTMQGVLDRLARLESQEQSLRTDTRDVPSQSYGPTELPSRFQMIPPVGRVPTWQETPFPRQTEPASQPSEAPRVAEGLVGHPGELLHQEQAGGRTSFAGEAGGLPTARQQSLDKAFGGAEQPPGLIERVRGIVLSKDRTALAEQAQQIASEPGQGVALAQRNDLLRLIESRQKELASGKADSELDTLRNTLAGKKTPPVKAEPIAPEVNVGPSPATRGKTLAELKVELEKGQRGREAGGIDRSLLEDVVEHGRRLYTNGKDFVAWSADMLREVGEHVRPYLDEVWKRLTTPLEQIKTREREQRSGFVLSGPRIAMTPKESGFTDPAKPVEAMQLRNRLRNKIHPDEWQYYEDALPKEGKISPQEAAKLMQDAAPRVEVRKAGESTVPAWQKRYHELTHEVLDNLTPEGKADLRTAVSGGITTDELIYKRWGMSKVGNNTYEAKIREFVDLAKRYQSTPSRELGQKANWQAISPKQKTPNYTEIAIVRGKRDVLEGEKFQGSHGFPANTVAFSRGHMEVPSSEPWTGKKVWFVTEIQSDWENQRRKEETRFQGYIGRGEIPDTTTTRSGYSDLISRPEKLLRHYERLALKATLDHALKEGAEAVAVQDAESAMMTEGHDQGAPIPQEFVVKEVGPEDSEGLSRNTGAAYFYWHEPLEGSHMYEPKGQNVIRPGSVMSHAGDKVYLKRFDSINQAVDFAEEFMTSHPWIPKQAKGMRLHYDQTLPKIASELTGQEGEVGSFGEHKMAVESNPDSLNPNTRPRNDLIFKNPDGSFKTDVSARVYPLDKIKGETSGFSLFDKDRPEQRGSRLYTAGPLDPDFWKGRVEHVKGLFEESRQMESLRDLFSSDRLKDVWMRHQGYDVPATTRANSETADRLFRFASARSTVDYLSRSLATDVLGEQHTDKQFDRKLQAVIVEGILRQIKEDTGRETTSTVGKEWGFFKNEKEFRSALVDKKVQAAIERHKELVQPYAQELHEKLGGKLAKGDPSGAFLNLQPLLGLDSVDEVKSFAFGTGRDPVPRQLQHGSAHSKQRKGTAEAYALTGYRDAVRFMLRSNLEEVAKQELYRSYLDKGLAVAAKENIRAPELGGKSTERVVVDLRRGKDVKAIWLRKDLVPELRQALQTDSPIPSGLLRSLANLNTQAQVSLGADAMIHTANIFTSVNGAARESVGKNIFGAREIDTFKRVGGKIYQVLQDKPEVQRELAELAKIGLLRAESDYKGPLHFLGFGGALLRLVDKAGRLAMDELYKEQTSMGGADNPIERRRFTSGQLGQYNRQLMTKVQQLVKESGASPFVVAGKTFNRLAVQRLLLSPGLKAVDAKATGMLRARQALALVTSVVLAPALANLYTVGQMTGRSGVPLGAIDLGPNHDNEDGSHTYIDPAQWLLLRRGERITGLQAVEKGLRSDKSAKDIAWNAGKDVGRGLVHPFAGPVVESLSTARFGESVGGYQTAEFPKQASSRLEAAAEHVNPMISAVADSRKEKSGASGFTQRLGSMLKLEYRTAPPSLAERTSEIEKRLGPELDKLKPLDRRAKVRKELDKGRKPLTDSQTLSAGERQMEASVMRRAELRKSLSEETSAFLKKEGLQVQGFEDELTYKGAKLRLSEEEKARLTTLIKDGYEQTVAQLSNNGAFRKATKEQKQHALDLALTGVRRSAHATLEKELQSGKPSEAKKRRFSIREAD